MITALVLKKFDYFNYVYSFLSPFIEQGKTAAREYKEEKALQLKEELPKRKDMFTSEIASKWLFYNQQLKFTSCVSLSDIIKSFSFPMLEFAKAKYPDVIKHRELFWPLLIRGIQKSGHPSKNELDEAIETLREEDLTQFN